MYAADPDRVDSCSFPLNRDLPWRSWQGHNLHGRVRLLRLWDPHGVMVEREKPRVVWEVPSRRIGGNGPPSAAFLAM